MILNRRKDTDAWSRSFQVTLCDGVRDKYWLAILSVLTAEYFWLRKMVIRYVVDWFDGSFEKNGTTVYREHYRSLEELLGGESSGRYLSWTVEDGWNPLCEYLEKPIPAVPFPSGNAPPAFLNKIKERRDAQIKIVKRNAMFLLATFVVTGRAIAYGLVYS